MAWDQKEGEAISVVNQEDTTPPPNRTCTCRQAGDRAEVGGIRKTGELLIHLITILDTEDAPPVPMMSGGVLGQSQC